MLAKYFLHMYEYEYECWIFTTSDVLMEHFNMLKPVIVPEGIHINCLSNSQY